MAHFEDSELPEELWKGLQKHLGYSDEELERFRKDPKKVRTALFMPGPEMRSSTLVFEVVNSHGCAEGMKVGDKLYFTGCGLLDLKRSSSWCAFAMSHISTFALIAQNMILQGLDPNEMYTQFSSCLDCGSEHGWGQVAIKAYVIKENIAGAGS